MFENKKEETIDTCNNLDGSQMCYGEKSTSKDYCVFPFICVCVKVTQSCPTLYNPVGCNLPGFSVHGILQARILEWVAIPFSRGFSQFRDWTQVSHIAGGFFTSWDTSEAQEYWSGLPIPSPADFPNPETEPRSPALQANFFYQLSYQGRPFI